MVSSCSILFTYFKTVFAFALRPFLPMWTASVVGQQHLVLYCNYNGDVTPKFDLVKTDWGVHSIKGQRAWTASVMTFLGIPHLTIFSTLKYPCQICQIRPNMNMVFGTCVQASQIWWVGNLCKDHAKCSSDALTLGTFSWGKKCIISGIGATSPL